MSSRPIVLSLTPFYDSFWFAMKQFQVTSTPITLGASTYDSAQDDHALKPSQSNGYFRPKVSADESIGDILPLSLSPKHAEVWAVGDKVYIRDLDTPFGTFVNGFRIAQETQLKSGDILGLGSKVTRNTKTPAYITDDHLMSIVATVTIS